MKSNYLCVDCKHCFITLEFRYNCRKAYEETHITYNPVTGGKKDKGKYKSCTFSRADSNLCGPDAKFWTPKNKKDLFLAILK